MGSWRRSLSLLADGLVGQRREFNRISLSSGKVAAISAALVASQQLQMEEGAWDRAVEQAQGGESAREVQALTLDGVVKCAQGKLPKSKVFAPFTQLKRLSIANVGLSSLADFPSLPLLEQLILSDNRIAGGLEHLVYAGLTSLRELDLSNNKIQALEDLNPLTQFKLESLDLYKCTVTRSVDYRCKVFGMMSSLRFLDKTDVAGNERPESDEESEEEDVDDIGDGLEVEGEEGLEDDWKGVGLLDDEEEEGEDDEELENEEEDEGGSYQGEVVAVSGCRVVQGFVNNDHGSDDEVYDEDDNVEVQDVEESEGEELGEEGDEDAAVEEEEDDEEPVSGAHVSVDGDLDILENEDDDLNENGELGDAEEDDRNRNNDAGEEVEEEDEAAEKENGMEHLVHPIIRPKEDEADDCGQDHDLGNGEDDEDPLEQPLGLKQIRKRTREETFEEEQPAKH